MTATPLKSLPPFSNVIDRNAARTYFAIKDALHDDSGKVLADAIPDGLITADMIAAGAITAGKIDPLSANKSVVTDGSGQLANSAASATEVGYLSGVTSAIQTQLDAKAASNDARLYRNLVTLGSDVASSASTSFQDITGLSFAVTSGVNYRFYAVICYTTSDITIGLKASLTAPAVTHLAYNFRTGGSSTASASAEYQSYQYLADNGSATVQSITTSGGNLLIMEGFIRPSADGTVQLRFAPETATANGIVIESGSTLEWW